MSATPSEVEAIEEALQDAALDPWRWAAALRRMSRHVAGDGADALAALTFIDGEGATGPRADDARPHLARRRRERPRPERGGGLRPGARGGGSRARPA